MRGNKNSYALIRLKITELDAEPQSDKYEISIPFALSHDLWFMDSILPMSSDMIK